MTEEDKKITDKICQKYIEKMRVDIALAVEYFEHIITKNDNVDVEKRYREHFYGK